jgi:hypothetical protein
MAVTELLDELATWTETRVAAIPVQASRP